MLEFYSESEARRYTLKYWYIKVSDFRKFIQEMAAHKSKQMFNSIFTLACIQVYIYTDIQNTHTATSKYYYIHTTYITAAYWIQYINYVYTSSK